MSFLSELRDVNLNECYCLRVGVGYIIEALTLDLSQYALELGKTLASTSFRGRLSSFFMKIFFYIALTCVKIFP